MDIKKIFEHNRAWVTNKLQSDPTYFNQLAEGQNPEILYIGCSDSRVQAEDIMGIQPGEAFVHRNIANLVNNVDLSAMSVINYAVTVLKVNHIVVCGHYNCGGVHAAMQAKDVGILNPWLRSIRDIYRLHQTELDNVTNETARYDKLVELNVKEQCINVLKTAEVQVALKERAITVHGWVFDVRTGKLIDLNINVEQEINHIKKIYRLV
jgi:carbonic anhydrase